MDQDKSAADHWQFSLAVYTRDGVAEHCLTLQHTLGLDVNVLLLMLWAARRWGNAPTAEQIADADSEICAWRREIVIPLRQLRTRLKSGPAPAPDAMTDVLRQDIKRLELDAERMQQEVLAQWVKEQTQAIPGAAHGGTVQQMMVMSQVRDDAWSDPATQENASAPQRSSVALADTAENARQLAVLEQTAVRVVAHYEAQYDGPAYGQAAIVEGGAAGLAADEHTADPWVALQHAHQVVLAAVAVFASA
ncbi:TIGR02444 family protein [Advenella sp. FME57]|uniref:TIGR02444 family protein n=1 Tax=Advenella sp. FME57 TaxID=2742604 RepID=UPI001866DEFA|nr:TIGR02444 family protein [Advenella sp. FME57]